MDIKHLNLKCLDQARKLLPEPRQPYQRAYINLPERITPQLVGDNSIQAMSGEAVDMNILEFKVEMYCIGSDCELEWELVL